jgi:HD-GYP domain-containing protein (c-di-GMP phosphodiesterase class II)
VRATHERYDGRGYPDGLSGEQIPLAARIIAICDAYQAMISNRGYWDARTEQQAREELQRCAGSQFDPRIVGVFLDFVQSFSRASEPRRPSMRAGETPRPAR